MNDTCIFTEGTASASRPMKRARKGRLSLANKSKGGIAMGGQARVFCHLTRPKSQPACQGLRGVGSLIKHIANVNVVETCVNQYVHVGEIK